MDSLLFLLYEALASLLPFLLFLLLLRRREPLRKGSPPKGAALLFGLYITAVFHFTGAGTLWELLRYQMELRPEQINLLPFSRTIDPIAYGQNLLLLLPLGFLLPLLGKRFHKILPAILAGFSLSLLLELSQLCNSRRTDIDDLLLNTLGALLGWLLWRLACRGRGGTGPSWFPLLSVAVLFAGRFLLYHDMALARLLYGF